MTPTELEYELNALRATWVSMWAKVQDTEAGEVDNREEVLAWCRERLDLAAEPAPAQLCTFGELRRWSEREDARQLREIDAQMRACLEKILTTQPGDLN